MLNKFKSRGEKKAEGNNEENLTQADHYLDEIQEIQEIQDNLDQGQPDHESMEAEDLSFRKSRLDKDEKTRRQKGKWIKKTKSSKDEMIIADEFESDQDQEIQPKMSFREKLKQKPKKLKKRRRIIKTDRISIDIGSKYIKIVEGMYDGKLVTAKNIVTVKTPENSYRDGEITDFISLKNEIESAISSADISSKEVIYTMESKSIVSREVELPSLIEKDIKQMMEYQLEEYFPVNLEEYVVQSKVVEEIDTAQRKESKLSVSILPKRICEEYLRLSEALHLKPIALDMNDNSIYKLLTESFETSSKDGDLKGKTIATLDIGHNITNISIIEDGIFRFSRLIDVGGKDINKNIEELLNITQSEVERIKLNIGSILTQDDDLEEEEESQLDSIKNVIQGSLIDLCEEVEKIFRYHTGRSSGDQIDEIYIYGATARMIDIDKFIENTLSVPTYKINKLESVRLVKKYKDVDIIQYANAMGAIMRM